MDKASQERKDLEAFGRLAEAAEAGGPEAELAAKKLRDAKLRVAGAEERCHVAKKAEKSARSRVCCHFL